MQMCVGAENFLPTDMSVNKHVCPPKEICVRTTAIHNQEWALKNLLFSSIPQPQHSPPKADAPLAHEIRI
jgi:hypothetical protein